MSNWKIKVFSKCWQQIKIISSKNYLRSTMRPQIPPHLWSSRDRNSFPDIHCKRYYCDSNRYYYNGNQLNAPLHVVHDMGGRRFYINFHEMGKAFIRYETDGRKIILKHTFVPDELRGYNIAQHLAEVRICIPGNSVYLQYYFFILFAGSICIRQGK